ncbi:MAG: ATP-binding protein [Odoribacter sp.]|nr:ATP-binding protein [Odoribacter sp.]
MKRRTRLIFLGLSLLILIVVGGIVIGNFEFLINDFWFTSGLLLMILLSLVDQPYFSKDSDIFINAITAGLSLLLINPSLRDWIFWVFLSVTLYLLMSSYLIMLIRNKPLIRENRVIQFISRINRAIGNPQTLFSAFFLWGIIVQFGTDSNEFKALLVYWAIFMIVSLPAVASAIGNLFDRSSNIEEENALGQIFGVQSKNTFLVRLFSDRNEILRRFDWVEFIYSMDDVRSVRKGLILDSYLLNEQQWVKILASKEIDDIFGNRPVYSNHAKDAIYKITDIPETDYLNKFVGLITENSNINKIRFIYNSKVAIQEGQLLEIHMKQFDSIVYYQIIDGITKIEQLEQKNETGYIVGEAIKLGTWNEQKSCFEQFGWVPEVNSPLYIASPISETVIDDGDVRLGFIPNTNFPVILDKNLALTHHTAILGITGTGKSVFSRNLIREYLKDAETKVICIDFTGEYKDRFSDIPMSEILSAMAQEQVFSYIDQNALELEKFSNQQNKELLLNNDKNIKKAIGTGLKEFFESDSKLSIIELPEVANTGSILDYTKRLFQVLFKIAKIKKCYGHKVCIVLEEAHTVIPEWSFVGVADKSSQSLLNSIAQIALQGRKYDVGLLVIAQRTANVSKTILTQCNTIVAFQEFDKTSSDFLSNYFGEGIATALPNLKFRQAIAAGKALKSNIPMIFEVPYIDETDVAAAAVENMSAEYSC